MANSKERNLMMRCPVLEESTLNFMRNNQKQWTGDLLELEIYAKENNIPIIPHETAVFMEFILKTINPKNILEIGTAIGFSAILMAKTLPNAKIETIDRFEIMIDQAKSNFQKYKYNDQITLLEGNADDILGKLPHNYYDFIFMDCSKQWYKELLEQSLDLLSVGGIIVIDDIFQGGTVFKDENTMNSTNRKIREGLRRFYSFIHELEVSKQVESTMVGLGDGLMMIRKTSVV